MRAVCEACGAAQPTDWQAGDRCTSCGEAVRREVRCFWCVRWTPDLAFCRHCGADVVDEALFGAARMLKDAGTDRFSVPEQLLKLGPDRVENFGRIYQRHAVVVAAHVDELAEVESHLRGRHGLAAALEDQLLAELPWRDDVRDRYAAAIAPVMDSDDRWVAAIRERTPFDVTRQAACVAAVRLGDLGAVRPTIEVLVAPAAPALRGEAAIALGGWRVRAGVIVQDLPWPREELDAALAELAPADPAAAVCLAAWRRAQPDPDLRHRPLDAESAFDLALQTVDLDVLRAALGAQPVDALARVAAARVLIRAGHTDGLAPLLAAGDDVSAAVVGELALAKRVVPDLEAELVAIACDALDPALRRRATQVVARAAHEGSVLRIARANLDDGGVIQALLQGSGVDRTAIEALADVLLHEGSLTTSQFGVSTVAEDGRLGDRYVPSRWGEARVDESCVELLKIAEIQFGARADDDLHRFVLGVLFGRASTAVRVAAFWGVHRWYRATGDMRGEGPFALTSAQLAWIGWTPAEAAGHLAALLGDHAALGEVSVYDWVANLLGTVDDEVAAAWVAAGRAGVVVDALDAAIAANDRVVLVQAMQRLRARLGE